MLAGCPRPGQGYHGRVPTIYEVARRAGVSTATVSRVLSQPQVVSPATRRKVMNAVDRLGYTPNAAAKNTTTARKWSTDRAPVPTFQFTRAPFIAAAPPYEQSQACVPA